MSGITRTSAHAEHAAALLQLAKVVGSGRGPLSGTLRDITEAATLALHLERCGIWMYDEGRTTIRCINLFERSRAQHSEGGELAAAEFPNYFAALAKERVVAADDACTDPRTSEFAESYLKPQGIGAMIDAPIWLGGGVTGIVCHEHVGPPREWTAEDQSFAAAVADLVSLALEIDRRSAAEGELRRREAHLRTLANVAHDVVFEVDHEGCYVHVSPNVERLMGFRPEELVGQPMVSFLHPSDAQVCATSLARALEDDGPVTALVRHRLADGAWRPFECSLTSYTEESGQRRVVVMSRDVTERLAAERDADELQRRLARSQRLEAVGRLAGGIAHDFNNMLTVITSAADDLLRAVPDDGPAHECARAITEAAERSASLTRQLLVFSSRGMFRREVLDASAVVADLDRMLGRVIGEDVTLELSVPGGPAWVRADPAQLEQVIVNLAVNARDAMPKGGVLSLSVERRVFERSPPGLLDPIEPGDWVVLSVADTGTGIEPALRERIFDPFFTTKDPGKGTGLGLATVYGVVRQLGGSVGVSSESGQGSTFSVLLPAHDELAPEAPEPVHEPEPNRRHAHILLVEDERLVRELVHDCLEEAGHQVTVAASPEQALVLAGDLAGIDLLLSDVVMPGMSGVELWRRLAERRPGFPAVFMSGYPDQANTGVAHVPEGAVFLPKPFKPADLAASVERALPAKG
jgi:hypothetical protein